MSDDAILPSLIRIPSRVIGPHHPVNSYVWRRAGASILIDPSRDVTSDLAPNITDIVITHVHAENVAGCANFPDARVHLPAGEEYLAAGLEAYLKPLPNWTEPWEWDTRGNFVGHIGGARNERPPATPIENVRPLHDGEHELGLRVVRTPGHGKHSVTTLATIDGRRVAFSGDLIFGRGQMWNWFDCEWDYGLQDGQRSVMESARRLLDEPIDLLCPTHGPMIETPRAALALLARRLEEILSDAATPDLPAINFPDVSGPADGFRAVSPHLHHWRSGNCAVIVSDTGNAMLIDDGLCCWTPLDQRRVHHDEVIARLKHAFNIRRIDTVIPTHYHGDHIENIPDIVRLDAAQVICLDTVAEPILHPQRFNLCCPLPWYGTAYDTIPIDRIVPDGTRIKWHEYELEIFHVGGQTYYHAGISATIDGRRVVFTGDSIDLVWPGCEPVLCYNDGEPSRRGWAYAIQRIASRNPDLLVGGHGAARRDPRPFLHKKLRAWDHRLRQFDALDARGDRHAFFTPANLRL